MVKLLVIADDFTGALDTGVQFSKKDIPTIVSTDENIKYELLDEKIQVVVLDIETRHINSFEAFLKVKKVVDKAKEYGIKYIYKKTDSTLRGNIGSELAGAIKACNSNELFFIPSFPKANRTTINGQHYVDGKPLNKTAYANDPFEPTKHSSIAEIINSQSNIEVVTIKQKDYETFQLKEDKQAIYVFDAQNDLDLMKIGKVLKERKKLKLTAGCAGFAGILTEILELKRDKAETKQYELSSLIISGSVNTASINQVKYSEKLGYKSIILTPKQLLAHDYFNSSEGEAFIHDIVSKINKGDKIIIKTAEDRSQVKECLDYSVKLNINPKKAHLLIAENIGKMVKQVLDKTTIGHLVIFGGDTAFGIIKALGCNGIVPQNEIFLGVVASDILSNKYNVQIITKAGGFGSDDTLIRIVEYLK